MADDADDEPSGDPLAEGLRERKKRLTRQLLSDTATMLFLERGFDGFKITEVAEACGVSEKTVYNYFPTKESLILDREEDTAAAIRHALRPGSDAQSPVEAILDVLASERRQMREGMADIGGDEAGLSLFRRFMTMVEETPSLRAAEGEMRERLARVIAEALAARAGVSPDDPEPIIAGKALIGLVEVQQQALRRDVTADTSAADVYDRADEELRRAARLIDTGLWSFSALVSGGGSREQLRAAAEATQSAGRQVAAAVRQARKLWSEMPAHGADSGSGHAKRHDAWAAAAGAGDQGMSEEDPQHWKELQREQVQRWREAQRELAQQWRETARAYHQERREAQRRMKEDLRATQRAQQAEQRDARRRSGGS
jgi:AcrR family transcriptional regulator